VARNRNTFLGLEPKVGQDEQGRRVLELVMGILLELELLVKRQVRGSLNRHHLIVPEEKKLQVE
jgi:hypothetical protein